VASSGAGLKRLHSSAMNAFLMVKRGDVEPTNDRFITPCCTVVSSRDFLRFLSNNDTLCRIDFCFDELGEDGIISWPEELSVKDVFLDFVNKNCNDGGHYLWASTVDGSKYVKYYNIDWCSNDNLNGNNGEVTGSDDMSGNKSNKKQKELREMTNLIGTLRKLSNNVAGTSNKNKDKNNRKRRISSAQVAKTIQSGRAIIHPGTVSYFRGLLNPALKNRPYFPCYDNMPALSQKARGFASFEAVIGTLGFGYAAFNPNLSNNQNCCYGTTATYSQNFINTNGGAFLNSVQMSNLAYPSASFVSPELEGRVVASSMRVSYTGTQLNMGGTYYAFSDTFNGAIGSIGAGYTVADMAKRKDCRIVNISRKPCSVVQLPIDSDSLEFGTKISPWTTVNSVSSGICFTGTAGNTFLVEIIFDTEYIGTLTEAASTRNPVTTGVTGHHALSAAQRARSLAMSGSIDLAALTATASAANAFINNVTDSSGLIAIEDGAALFA